MKPRLNQPLFKGMKDLDRNMYHIMRAYDCIWTLLYEPHEIRYQDRVGNARVNLEALGEVIENAVGEGVFASSTKQLSFDEELLG